jgi:hypothetical protein
VSDDQKNQTPEDMFQTLLVQAAESAAKREAQDALEKGFVTRKDINLALAAFGEQLEEKIVTAVQTALLPQVEELTKKAIGTSAERKSTILTEDQERDNDPVAYIVKKGREQGVDAFNDEDKRFIWGMTHAALTDKMTFDPREE